MYISALKTRQLSVAQCDILCLNQPSRSVRPRVYILFEVNAVIICMRIYVFTFKARELSVPKVSNSCWKLNDSYPLFQKPQIAAGNATISINFPGYKLVKTYLKKGRKDRQIVLKRSRTDRADGGTKTYQCRSLLVVTG